MYHMAINRETFLIHSIIQLLEHVLRCRTCLMRISLAGGRLFSFSSLFFFLQKIFFFFGWGGGGERGWRCYWISSEG